MSLEFLGRFCAGDIDGLEALLAGDLRFTGPFHTCASASEYLQGLRQDPPESCGFRALSVTEGPQAVAIFYEYQRPDRVLPIAQLFRFSNGKIAEGLLVFDGRDVG